MSKHFYWFLNASSLHLRVFLTPIKVFVDGNFIIFPVQGFSWWSESGLLMEVTEHFAILTFSISLTWCRWTRSRWATTWTTSIKRAATSSGSTPTLPLARELPQSRWVSAREIKFKKFKKCRYMYIYTYNFRFFLYMFSFREPSPLAPGSRPRLPASTRPSQYRPGATSKCPASPLAAPPPTSTGRSTTAPLPSLTGNYCSDID